MNQHSLDARSGDHTSHLAERRIDEKQRSTSKKLLGPRAQSWHDTAEGLSGIAKYWVSYAEPDNT
jgi:hypothetical protein